MGRKGNFSDKPKRGPGKKTKKQNVPEFSGFIEEEKDETNLSRRQRIRAKKRSIKTVNEAVKESKKMKLELPLDSEDDSSNIDESEKDANAGSEESEKDSNAESDESEKDSNTESDEDGDDEFSSLEKKSAKLEKEKKRVYAESKAELRSAAENVGIEIPSLEEVQKELEINPDMGVVSSRIKDTVFVLANFKDRREEGRSRKEYLSILEHDLCAYYSYNTFLIKKLMDLFSLTELIEFLEANEVPRPVTLRTNTLKTRRKQLAQSLISQGVNLDVIPWSKVGLIVYSSGSTALGATTEYLAGHYILQGASSFLPVVSLAPKENEKVLDLCAAPGGKSTHIAAMMRNTGILFSNDFNVDRTKALVGNFHRMGISNTVITAFDGRKFSKMMPCAFDRALVDAPCSGTGVISKDEQIKISKEEKDIKRCSHMQKELLLSAIDCVDAKSSSGGYICYSTCSILCEENEEIISYALSKRKVKLVPTGLEVGKEGLVNYRGKRFHPSLKLCKRIYPHTNNMDGFFVAKLKKLSNEAKIISDSPDKEMVTDNVKEKNKRK